MELGSLDSDAQLPSQVYISHFLALFIFDFIYSFLTNFSRYENKKFASDFKQLDQFLVFSLSLLSKTTHNFNSFFEYSDKKRKTLEHECDKTEYKRTDTFNYFGICLAYLYLFDKNNSNNVLPKVINHGYNLNISLSIYNIISNQENSKNIITLKEHKQILKDILIDYILPSLNNLDIQNKKMINNLINIARSEINQDNWELSEKLIQANTNENVIKIY